MNSGDSAGLGGPLKKPAAKPEAKKPLGGLGVGGKSIGGEAPAPAAPATSSAPASFEFEDEPPAAKPAAKKPAAAPAAFNPFDQPVAVPAANAAAAPSAPTAPGTGRIEKPGTGRVEKPGTGRVEKPAAPRATKPVAADPAEGDIAPGLAKDLWVCPHCGAKNKPSRETCRECKKSPQDEVAKPWFLNPVIIGPVVGGLVLVVVLVMWLSSVDLTLHPVGTVDKAVRSASVPQSDVDLGDTRKFTIKRTAAVSGRVLAVTDYPAAPWLQAVVVGLGSGANDDAVFATWKAEFDGSMFTVTAPRHATLFLIHSGAKPTLKPGDYLSVLGDAGVPEQDHTIVPGTDHPNCWTIRVKEIASR